MRRFFEIVWGLALLVPLTIVFVVYAVIVGVWYVLDVVLEWVSS